MNTRQPRVGSPAAAAMSAQQPNDTRVRGAGPARKTFVGPKACKTPHPLQPIVRPRLRAGTKWPTGTGAALIDVYAPVAGSDHIGRSKNNAAARVAAAVTARVTSGAAGAGALRGAGALLSENGAPFRPRLASHERFDSKTLQQQLELVH
jgi:hypothetical protein